jgi:hypothetical protein
MSQKLKVLHLVHHENWIDENGEIRRPRTYQVDEEKLPPRMTLREYRKRRFTKSRHSSHVQSIAPSSPPLAPEPAAPASTPTPQAAAPVPVATPQAVGEKSHRSFRPEVRGVRKIRETIVNAVTTLMRPRWDGDGYEETALHSFALARSPVDPDGVAVPDPWAAVLGQLAQWVNPHSYETWLKPTKHIVLPRGDKTLRVSIPTGAFSCIGTQYGPMIQKAVTDLRLGYELLQFQWTEKHAKEIPAVSFREAVLEACQANGIPLEAALDATGWKKKFDEAESP